MASKYEVSSQEDKKLLNSLKTKNNKDGYFELVMSNHKIDQKHINSFFPEFEEDEKLYSQIVDLYVKMSLPNFRKKIKLIAQISIRNKVISGTASYEFIKNVASVSNLDWILQELSDHPDCKKLKILYFQKRFEILCFLKKRPSRYLMKKLSVDYQKSAKNVSKYLLDLCSDNSSAFILLECDEDLILKELKHSF